jgi:hypothetical protein
MSVDANAEVMLAISTPLPKPVDGALAGIVMV